jgi:hypothetical protein
VAVIDPLEMDGIEDRRPFLGYMELCNVLGCNFHQDVDFLAAS